MKKILGTFCLLFGICLFSTIEIGQKFLVKQCGQHIDPYIMVFVRFIVTGIVLLGIGLPLMKKQSKQLQAKDFLVFLLNGLCGITLCLSLFHYAIDQFQNASSAAVVFSANAVFVVIFARFINGEAWSVGKWTAMLLGLCGIGLFMFEKGAPSSDTFKALGLMCVAAMLFALSVCYTKLHVARCGPMVYMGGSSLLGGLMALPLFFILSEHTFVEAIAPMGKAYLGMAYFVFVATAFAYYLYYTGIACTSAFHASMAFMLKPVLACVLAQLASATGWLPSESRMNAATISGTVLIVIAMLMAQIMMRREFLKKQAELKDAEEKQAVGKEEKQAEGKP